MIHIKLKKPLMPYQKDIHNGVWSNLKDSTHTVLAKRQVGKSYYVSFELICFSLENAGSHNYCVSPSLNQSRLVYDGVYKALEDTGFLAKHHSTRLELYFTNGSYIKFKSAEQRKNLRGMTVDGLLCIDEAAFISDEIYEILTPIVDATKSTTLIVSTPMFKSGFFYDKYMAGYNEKEELFYSYSINDYDTSRFLSPKKLEMYRRTLSKSRFMTEYLGQFLDGDSLVFGDFNKCLHNDIKYTSKDLYVGIDWAKGLGKGDSTSITVLTKNKEQFAFWSFDNIPELEQMDKIYELLKPYKDRIKVITTEANSFGSTYHKLLKKKFSDFRSTKFINVNTANGNKAKWVEQLKVEFQENHIKLLIDKKQIDELTMYELSRSKTGKMVYNAPTGKHDDSVISLLICLDTVLKYGGNSHIKIIK